LCLTWCHYPDPLFDPPPVVAKVGRITLCRTEFSGQNGYFPLVGEVLGKDPIGPPLYPAGFPSKIQRSGPLAVPSNGQTGLTGWFLFLPVANLGLPHRWKKTRFAPPSWLKVKNIANPATWGNRKELHCGRNPCRGIPSSNHHTEKQDFRSDRDRDSDMLRLAILNRPSGIVDGTCSALQQSLGTNEW